jgi:hypothetical protein
VASASALTNINFRIPTAPCFDSVDAEQAVKTGCRQALAYIPPSSNDSNVALPPAEVVSVETARSATKR